MQVRDLSMTQIQAVNDLGNLLFLVFLLGTLTLASLLIYRKLRGRPTRAVALALFACLLSYAAILIGFSLTSQTRELALGTDKCFDDWCATVTGARSLPNANGAAASKLVAVALHVSNRARGAAFRPSQPRVSLTLSTGRATPSASAQREFERQAGLQQDLAKRLVAGESFKTTLVFEVPAGTRATEVVLLEGPAFITRFLAGDENSFFHKKMVYPIVVQ
jgi:hypothetical protein